MILRPSTRSQPLLRTFLRANNISRFQQRRCEHTVPKLGANNYKGTHFEEHGVPGFLTPKTYRQTWLEYQRSLCEYVNESTEGLSKYANSSPYALHERFAHDPSYASLYNATAMLHFNHVWWESLAIEKTSIPKPVLDLITKEFGSLDNLRTEMLQHGDAMFGNGFVWLVKERAGSNSPATLRILCTYNAGSPYPNAHARRQTTDMATNSKSSVAAERLSSTGSKLTYVQNNAGSMGPHSVTGKVYGQNLLNAHPILSVNVWQHMYMLDYGITGKRTYLAAWWESIDWDVVHQRFNMDPQGSGGRQSPIASLFG